MTTMQPETIEKQSNSTAAKQEKAVNLSISVKNSQLCFRQDIFAPPI